MSLETPPAPLPRAKLREVLVGLVLALVVGAFYLWTAEKPGDSWLMTSKDPEGYYPLETAGFRAGHLYAAITPIRRSLRSRTPMIRSRTPRTGSTTCPSTRDIITSISG